MAAVSSSITVDAVYLDARVSGTLSGSVGTLEDSTEVITTDNGLVSTHERWSRVKQLWNLSWSTATTSIETLYKVNRSSRGFLFISPRAGERDFTTQLLRNTTTGLNLGDGSTTTFQLQVIDSTSAHSTTRDVIYPLSGSQSDINGTTFTSTVLAFKNGVAATVSAVGLTTGIITFASAPANAVVPTATFSAAWPVMFSSKTLQSTWLQVDQVEVRSAQIEEIF